MILYYDNTGKLLTIIPHGDIPRQMGALKLYILFDRDVDLANKQLLVNFKLPSSLVYYNEDYPAEKMIGLYQFHKIKGENIGSLIDDGLYQCFYVDLSDTYANTESGNLSVALRLNTTTENGEATEAEETFEVTNVQALGNVNIYIEETLGLAPHAGAGMTYSEYTSLLAFLNGLYSMITDGTRDINVRNAFIKFLHVSETADFALGSVTDMNGTMNINSGGILNVAGTENVSGELNVSGTENHPVGSEVNFRGTNNFSSNLNLYNGSSLIPWGPSDIGTENLPFEFGYFRTLNVNTIASIQLAGIERLRVTNFIGDLIPEETGTKDIGSQAKSWRDAYFTRRVISPEFVGSLTGNADTATNATNATNAEFATKDSLGNTIHSYYAKQSDMTSVTDRVSNIENNYLQNEVYLFQNTSSAAPTNELLNQVCEQLGVEPVDSGVVTWVQQIPDATDKIWRCIYSLNREAWDYYEIPATEAAGNGSLGIIQGSYTNANRTAGVKQILTDISGGEILNIYILDENGEYQDLRTYAVEMRSDVDDIQDELADARELDVLDFDIDDYVKSETQNVMRTKKAIIGNANGEFELTVKDANDEVKSTIYSRNGTIHMESVSLESDDAIENIASDLETVTDIQYMNNSSTKQVVTSKVLYQFGLDKGSTIEVSMNPNTYVMTINLKNSSGTVISTGSIDFPLEQLIVSGYYDAQEDELVFVLNNGNTITVDVSAILTGIQPEITVNILLRWDT